MFEKLDAYDIIANLVPGAALIYALHYSNFPSPSPDNLGAFLLVAFVAGVTTNRIGSLLIDPALRSVKFLNEKDYDAFVSAERKDGKLQTLVANHGLYRTFLTAGVVYLFLSAMFGIASYVGIGVRMTLMLFTLAGMFVFLFALKKEDGYIHVRIENAKKG